MAAAAAEPVPVAAHRQRRNKHGVHLADRRPHRAAGRPVPGCPMRRVRSGAGYSHQSNGDAPVTTGTSTRVPTATSASSTLAVNGSDGSGR